MPKYFLTNEVISTSLWKLLETNPAYSEDITTKAKVGKSAVCTYFTFNVGVTVTTAGDFPDISLAKNGWRTESPLNGFFKAGIWIFKVRIETDTKYYFGLRVAVRLSKSANADGSNATLIGVFESPNSLLFEDVAGSDVVDYWTASLPQINFNNEYLFVEYRIHIEYAGGSVLCQCSFACDEDPSVADESIITPVFIPLVGVNTLGTSDIETTNATLNGSHGFTATIRGFEWGTQSGSYPYSWTEEGIFSAGVFSHTITNLEPNKTYYFRAKAYSPTTGWVYGSEVSFQTLPSPSWLSGWSYRKKHIINPEKDAGTDYPIRIKVHYGSGTDSGEDVYLNGKCRTDFGDVRFTKSDGISELYYWIDEKVDGDYAIFWVRITDDLSINSVTIYIYYGNPSATTTSNQILTRIAQLKEHRYTTTISGMIFNKPTNTKIRVDSYSVGFQPINEGYVFFVVPASWINGKYIRWNWNGYFSYTEARIVADAFIQDGEYNRKSDTDFPNQSSIPDKGNGRLQTLYQENTYGKWGPYTRDVQVNISPALPYVTLFFKMFDAWTGETVYLEIDFVEVNTGSDGSGNIISLHFLNPETITMEIINTDNDYGLLRKFVSPEPSHSIWGSEESIAIIETITAKSFPMIYLPKPIKAQELKSKVEGATITHVSKDFPEELLKKDKAKELRSKFS
jgi:hypothetical protein